MILNSLCYIFEYTFLVMGSKFDTLWDNSSKFIVELSR